MTEQNTDKLAKIRAKQRSSLKLKASERKKLSKDDQKRYDKLAGILAKLKAKVKVGARELRHWLGEEDYASIAEGWAEEKTYRAELANIPQDLKDYEAKLKRGGLFTNRRDGKRKEQNKADVMDDFADKAFDDAADFLREILEENPEYVRYLDREVSLEAGATNSIGHCQIGIPRLITSRSIHRQSTRVNESKRTQNNIKIEVVENVLTEIVSSVRDIGVKKQSVQSDKLARLMNNTRLDDDIWEI